MLNQQEVAVETRHEVSCGASQDRGYQAGSPERSDNRQVGATGPDMVPGDFADIAIVHIHHDSVERLARKVGLLHEGFEIESDSRLLVFRRSISSSQT
jgi:hypothetical protein